MSIKISKLHRSNVVRVEYLAGSVTAADLAEHRARVVEILSESGFRKVLVCTESLVRFPPPLTALEHNEGLAAHDVLSAARFAVVCKDIGEDERYLEDSAINRGLELKCFTSEREALNWLD